MTLGLSPKDQLKQLVRALHRKYLEILDEVLRSPEGAFFAVNGLASESVGVTEAKNIMANILHRLNEFRLADGLEQLHTHIKQSSEVRSEITAELSMLDDTMARVLSRGVETETDEDMG
ncbi:Mediator complex, subunit Med7 [Carpediemonas membranifera]|uniref:Mediator of RNA polymerase II transcription subunit 7 n=1 Tax=Carpediemonas membranifera TaxID=201153 RepID=A0A8J6E0P2_9EUKA|nr:Mediator complex, subunit Med7 [Carpediemonas membranifera]|eukprot:KAG9392096.1 Mediator complex, subunit Med7 [Carpediemonas membranifera]